MDFTSKLALSERAKELAKKRRLAELEERRAIERERSSGRRDCAVEKTADAGRESQSAARIARRQELAKRAARESFPVEQGQNEATSSSPNGEKVKLIRAIPEISYERLLGAQSVILKHQDLEPTQLEAIGRLRPLPPRWS